MASLDVSHIKPLLDSAKSVTILLTSNPTYDAVAAGLACKLSLDASGKPTTIACETPMTVEFNRLIGVDSVTTSFGNRNLIISFDDQTELVDKVSYNLDNGELQLLITPKSNVTDIDHRRLKFTPSQKVGDLVLILDAHTLDSLGSIYTTAKDALSSAKLVSITRSAPNQNYTPHQVFSPSSSSLSEIMAHTLESLNLTFPPDVATNLLDGLVHHTQNFQADSVSHETFEVAARLLRHGASRHRPIAAADFPQGSIPTPIPAASTPVVASTPSNQAGYGTDSQPVAADPPSDWYEPKIYRGPMLQ